MTIKLTPGKFYRSRDKEIWCCYRVRPWREEHCQVDCIRVSDSRIEYFFLDGRYDSGGKREHCLLEEVSMLESTDNYKSILSTKTVEVPNHPGVLETTVELTDQAKKNLETRGNIPALTQATYVCSVCKDTHYVLSEGYTIMCNDCPTPCGKCMSDVPFCGNVPCACNCHK